MKYLGKLFSMDNQPSCRLLFGSVGFLVAVVLIILTVFGFNGTPEHVELMKHLMYVSASLIGLSAVDLSNLKNNKKDDDSRHKGSG